MTKNILFIALLGLVTVFSSCNRDEKVAPSVSFVGGAGFTSSDQTVATGTAIKVGITASCDQTMKKFQIKVAYDGQVPSMVLDSAISTKIFALPQYTFNARGIAGTEVWSFTLVDEDGLTTTVSFKVTTTATSALVTTFNAKLLGAQNATSGSSFSTTTGDIFTLDQAKAASGSVDFVYFFGATNQATLSAPDNNTDLDAVFTGSNRPSTWTTRNQTRFATTAFTTAQFDLITNVAALGTTTTTAVKANSLAIGNVIAFTTAVGKRGLIKITGITAGASGDITVTVKVAP